MHDCSIWATNREKAWKDCDMKCSWNGISSLMQTNRACIRGLVFLATLRANTFQVDAVNSSSGVYVTNSWRMCVCLARGGRETCLLCKVSSLPLLCLSLHLPPPPCSHMVPQGAIIWQHHPPPHVTTSCHKTSTYRVITPQENALTSWGCTIHLIRRTNQHILSCCHTHLTNSSKQELGERYI